MATLDFVNKQIWLLPSGNYVTHILAKSYTAGHHRAIADQVDMAPKDSQVEDSSLKKYILNVKQVPPPCFLGV